jgi:RNA polymerase sigma-70 factor (ECF subfamily)
VTTDLDLHLPAIAAGEKRAFGRWLAAAEPGLRAGLRPFAAKVDVESILQEALLRTWQVAPRVEPDGKPNALLRLAHRIARNLAISHLRGTRLEGLDGGEAEQPVEPREPDPLLAKLVRRCLEALPPRPRAAFQARLEARGGAEDGTLAERLRMTLNTFLQNVTRARKLMEECLHAKGAPREVEP